MPYLLQITDEPVGRIQNQKLLKSLVLYWMPIYENGRVVFKCMHSKCDYARSFYLSRDLEDECTFSEGKIHWCLMNVTEEDLMKIVDNPEYPFFNCLKNTDILELLMHGDESFDNICIKKVPNAEYVD